MNIAGVPGQGDIINLTLRTTAEDDHFADVNEMIRNWNSRAFTSLTSFVYYSNCKQKDVLKTDVA